MRRVDVVPHTHWDREWYLPFQRFRIRLVDTLDALLDDLDRDPAFVHFLLDGQMAAVDDYLEVRPEREAQLRRLAAGGRIAMGPWYTLPDEFLVSGETLVRNLQLGLRRAEELGGAMRIGYLPDLFGHIAQMPQILRSAGFAEAVVWRGVPLACTTRTAFRWSAPDGSTVRTEYLPTGYGNGSAAPTDPGALLARIRSWEDAHAGALGPHAPLLWMNGSDHRPHDAHLPAVLAGAQDLAGDRHELRITSLAEHLAAHAAAVADDEPPCWTGELRSSARANLLMGVASNGVEVRQAAARAERGLERIAEPLHATLLPAELWPDRLLDLAWREMVRNAAHDSICACSHDDVVLAVRHRYAEAAEIAEGLTERALRILGAGLASCGPVAVNTVAHQRGGLVEVTVPGEDPAPYEQLRSVVPSHTLLHEIRGRDAPVVVERELVDIRPDVHAVDLAPAPDGALDVHLHADLTRAGTLAAGQVVTRMAEALGPDPERPVRVHLHQPPQRTVLRHVASVPGFGWAAAVVSPVDPVRVEQGTPGGGVRMTNGRTEVLVDATDGTFTIDGLAGFGRLVDSGDAGDTYNHCPPAQDEVVDRPRRVAVEVHEEGPLRARVDVRSTYRWPERVDDASGRRVGAADVQVTTTVELRAGEGTVRVSHRFENVVEDHRLRAWLPLPQAATRSFAECAYAVVERGLTAEGGPTEVAATTFPSRRFVQAGGLTVVHDGLPEYELVDIDGDGAHALALTLVRATRMLSRGPMPTRPLPAGPEVELRRSQSPGHLELSYAVALGTGVDPYALADDVLVPLLVAEGAGLGDLPDEGQGLRVEGGVPLHAVLRDASGAIVVRAANAAAEPRRLALPGRLGVELDLLGRELRPFPGERLLRAGEIVTLRLSG